MPRYHFHIEDGRSFPDHDGTELPDLESARIEAIRLFGGLLRDDAPTFWNGDDWIMTVTDADQLILFSVNFMAFDAPATKQVFKPKHPAESLLTL